MVAPVLLSVVAFIAGHPTQIACDADTNPSPVATEAGQAATAWTQIGGNVIHVAPLFCKYASSAPGTEQFAEAIEVFIHEAAHARGIRMESCAEMTADIGVFDVLRRFYNIPFFSPLSEEVGMQVLDLAHTLPPMYQPQLCWDSGAYR